MADEFNLETRFSKSRGLTPYIAGVLGAVVLVLAFMYLTGIGRDALPYSAYFQRRAPTAADGSEALSLQTLTFKADEKSISIEGTVGNRTDSEISGLQAVIAVSDKYSLPVQTVNAPVEPADLPSKGIGAFRTVVPLGEHGFGTLAIDFRLPDDGPFVPHKDERPLEPVVVPPGEKKP
ncbi:MAG TPA: hypothetical protein VFE29_05955 [Terriglobia bacterium]|nr:hypothetical protein [Terriglobia bacterium]